MNRKEGRPRLLSLEGDRKFCKDDERKKRELHWMAKLISHFLKGTQERKAEGVISGGGGEGLISAKGKYHLRREGDL